MSALHDPIDLGDGKGATIDLVILHATPPPETTFVKVYRTAPQPDSRKQPELLGEFNWEPAGGYSEATGDDVATVRQVIDYLKKHRIRP